MSRQALATNLNRVAAHVLRRVRPSLVERQELGKFAQRHIAPLTSSGRLGEAAHAQGPRLACRGVEFSLESQRALVASFVQFLTLFDVIRTDASINVQHHQTGDRIRNGYFPTPDAETYAAMIALHRPARIVEVGGGFSTLIARATIDHLGLDTDLVVIDPEPRTDVQRSASLLIRERVESVGVDQYGLDDSSFLFIDSSHTLRTGGDVAYLYGAVIPALPSGVRVHIHDVFLPFEYSAFAVNQWWTEQYVLQALLSHSPRYKVELALRWLTETDPEAMIAVFGESVQEPPHGGGSLWFRVTSEP